MERNWGSNRENYYLEANFYAISVQHGRIDRPMLYEWISATTRIRLYPLVFEMTLRLHLKDPK